MRNTIGLCPPLPDEVVQIAQRHLPPGFALQSLDETGGPEFLRALSEIEYFMGLPRCPIDSGFYRAAPRLRLIQLLRSGYERVDVEAARRHGVRVATAGDIHAAAVAEHTMLLILATARRLLWQHQQAVSGNWHVVKPWHNTAAAPAAMDAGAQGAAGPAPAGLSGLGGKTLGIWGMGGVGRRVAALARAFGMRIVYWQRHRLPAAEEEQYGASYLSFEELLRVSDVVSLHARLQPDTVKKIGAAQLALMKPQALFINTARGGLVDEDALYQALRSGALAGAGLDVLAAEPPRPGHPLFQLASVTATPHSAWLTSECWEQLFQAGFANICRVAAGEEPLWALRPAPDGDPRARAEQAGPGCSIS